MAILIRPSNPIRITPSEVITVRPSQVIRVEPTETTRIVPVKPMTVTPPRRGAWDENGWAKRMDGSLEIFEGHYRVREQRFWGRVEKERSGQISAYIHNPPIEIKRHPHHACFQQVGIGTGWFHLHWRRAPKDVDGAILYMERILDESFR